MSYNDEANKRRINGDIDSSNYKKEYYNTKLEQGQSFEDAIKDFFKKNYNFPIGLNKTAKKQYQMGESKAGIEIKFDYKSQGTENFYIEMSEKSNPANPKYVPSGVMRVDNSIFYLIGNSDEFYVIRKDLAKQLVKNSLKEHGDTVEANPRIRKLPTSMGYLLPKSQIESLYRQSLEKYRSGQHQQPVILKMVNKMELIQNNGNVLVNYQDDENKKIPSPVDFIKFYNGAVDHYRRVAEKHINEGKETQQIKDILEIKYISEDAFYKNLERLKNKEDKVVKVAPKPAQEVDMVAEFMEKLNQKNCSSQKPKKLKW